MILSRFFVFFKLSQTNFDFLIWKRYINQFGAPSDLSPLCNIVLILAYPPKNAYLRHVSKILIKCVNMAPHMSIWKYGMVAFWQICPQSFSWTPGGSDLLKNGPKIKFSQYMTQFDPASVSQSLSSRNIAVWKRCLFLDWRRWGEVYPPPLPPGVKKG